MEARSLNKFCEVNERLIISAEDCFLNPVMAKKKDVYFQKWL